MSDEGKVLSMQSVIAKKNTREPSWSWIIIDATGKIEESEVEKYEIIRRVQIHSRDLRVLDPKLFYPSTILGRERAIVINLEHIKAIITADEVYFRNTSDENFIPVVEELQRRLNVDITKENSSAEDDDDDDESPFEFRVLEVALEAICSFLAARTTELEIVIYPALDALTKKINICDLDNLRKHKNTLNTLSSRVQKIRDELEQLLDDDDDMAELYLSRKLDGASSPISVADEPIASYPSSPEISAKISRAKSHLGKPPLAMVSRESDDVEDIEMLLEAYFIQIDSTLNKLTAIRAYFDDSEDYINVQLDNSRNEMIKFELIISAGSVCISVYALVCGIFGMNIPFSWNHKEYMFKWVVGVTTILCGVLFVIIMSYARYKRLVGN